MAARAAPAHEEGAREEAREAGGEEAVVGHPRTTRMTEIVMPPSRTRINEENELLRRLQERFRKAAEYVAQRFAADRRVARIVLFGSVAGPLGHEIPRFAEFRRAGIELLHECRDVDLAVWLDAPFDLRVLRGARAQALLDLHRETGIGVAHHQVDVFLFDAASDCYLGRLCNFNCCPKGKPECAAPGCGAAPFLRQIEGFRLKPEALAPDKSIVLYERGA